MTRTAFLHATILLSTSSYLFAASVELPNQFDAGKTHGWTAGQICAEEMKTYQLDMSDGLWAFDNEMAIPN